MPTKTINDLPELTSPASSDFVATWDISGVTTNKLTLANIYNLLLTQSNTFSAAQIIQPTGLSAVGLTISLPAGSTGNAILSQLNGTNRFQVRISSALGYFSLFGDDLGNNVAGPYLNVGRNTNATKPGSGFVALSNRSGTVYRLWPDASGNWRSHTADPIYDNDGAGTVIGTQTSSAASKNILGDVGDPAEALSAIVQAAKSGLRRFSYKSGAFDRQEFEGIVTDYAPRYGMDRDKEHPAGKALNEIQLLGDLVRAVAMLADKLGLVEE